MLKWQRTSVYIIIMAPLFILHRCDKPCVMNELVNSLQEKTELSTDQAQAAVDHVLNFLRNKLPNTVYQYVDNTAKGKDAGEILLQLEGHAAGYFGH